MPIPASLVEETLFGVVLQAGLDNPLFGVVLMVAIVVLGGLAFIHRVIFYGSFASKGESRPPASKTNCSACGARIPADRENCDYCGETVNGAT